MFIFLFSEILAKTLILFNVNVMAFWNSHPILERLSVVLSSKSQILSAKLSSNETSISSLLIM